MKKWGVVRGDVKKDSGPIRPNEAVKIIKTPIAFQQCCAN
jgi:hypothetical protein